MVAFVCNVFTRNLPRGSLCSRLIVYQICQFSQSVDLFHKLNLAMFFKHGGRLRLATKDMLLLRPPPRAILEAGPPASVKKALEVFESKNTESTDAALLLATAMGMTLPDH